MLLVQKLTLLVLVTHELSPNETETLAVSMACRTTMVPDR